MPCAAAHLERSHGGPGDCPFPGELISFQGKQWCPAHLPLACSEGTPSPKASWDEQRHAELARQVLDLARRQAAAGEGVDLRAVVLAAPLDFHSVALSRAGSLDLSGAEIHAPVSLRGETLPGGRFTGCRLLAGADFREVRFTAAADFSGCRFGGGPGLRGEAADDWVLPPELAAGTAEAAFNGAEFEADAGFSGARFAGPTNFTGARFRASADFADAEFAASALFSQVIFASHAGFVEARFGTRRAPLHSKLSPERTSEDAALFDGAHFGENAMFARAEFHCDAVFERTTINGQPYFKEARLEAGALFRQLTLQGTLRLDRARLAGRFLTEGQTARTVNLTRADLCGADARAADLAEAELAGARLHAANLQDADLSSARNALAEQFAGADVSGAKLPADIAAFSALEFVAEASRYARGVFMFLLAGCAYAWLSIATTDDAALVTNTGATQLPIINVAVPVAGFYWAAPALLLLVYLYFHLYLQRLWEALAPLPAVLPDGRPLHQRAHPWMLNGLVRAHFSRLRRGRPLYAHLEHGVTVALAWWLVPFTLAVFWLRYLPRHDWAGTLVQVAMILVSVAVAALALRLCRNTLRGVAPAGPRQAAGVLARRLAESAALGAGLLAVSWGAINGVPAGAQGGLLARHVPWVLETGLGVSAFARLTDADLSVKPPGWTGLATGAELEQRLAQVKKALLAGADLRHARATGAFLARADLRGADLTGMDLRGADLRGADLAGARLEEADLRGARLDQADLGQASLAGADLRGATGLDCPALDHATGWRSARRDPGLACGAPRPQGR